MNEQYYRIVVNDVGIYEAVEKLDPDKRSPLRENKPDGLWLKKVGKQYPGAVSFWSKAGLTRYIESGLMRWHKEFVDTEPKVIIAQISGPLLYEDEDQVIGMSDNFKILEECNLNQFLKEYNAQSKY